MKRTSDRLGGERSIIQHDLDQPVIVTHKGGDTAPTIRYDSLRKALHAVMLEFEAEALPSTFICTRQGGLNIVEIRALYNRLCRAYAGGDTMTPNVDAARRRRSPLEL